MVSDRAELFERYKLAFAEYRAEVALGWERQEQVEGSVMTDPKAEAIGAMTDIVRAARRLLSAWERLEDTSLLNSGYPERLPSFDEFVGELEAWQEKVLAAEAAGQ